MNRNIEFLYFPVPVFQGDCHGIGDGFGAGLFLFVNAQYSHDTLG